MGFSTAFLLALALSVDALVCAVIYGKRNFSPALRLRFAAYTALTFGGFQALMPAIGFYGGAGFAHLIESFDHWVAFVLLAVIAGKMIKDALFGEGEEQELRRLSLMVLLSLGTATSIDALALGFSLGLIYPSITMFALVTGITCAALSFAGFMTGQYLARFKKLDQGLNLLGGLVLLSIGLKILFEHQALAFLH
ncbi:MAG: manganese efflux pump [Proteobacteria bacterium]|uniref:Putative manganese efflux pump MntP n=1 Tax=Candidatus Avisuccinivibrio stercorigallinarum TaxID=2840704 RepID=A0A9D9DCM0_9GAMM|nr:manganese efflux pump [Candidatus Avisuccinivibrio stercorigallinarum]